jgi:hypothetical protein
MQRTSSQSSSSCRASTKALSSGWRHASWNTSVAHCCALCCRLTARRMPGAVGACSLALLAAFLADFLDEVDAGEDVDGADELPCTQERKNDKAGAPPECHPVLHTSGAKRLGCWLCVGVFQVTFKWCQRY